MALGKPEYRGQFRIFAKGEHEARALLHGALMEGLYEVALGYPYKMILDVHEGGVRVVTFVPVEQQYDPALLEHHKRSLQEFLKGHTHLGFTLEYIILPPGASHKEQSPSPSCAP